MDKEHILLELIHTKVNDKEKMSPIQIMKAMFLLKKELSLSDEEFYKFEPYLYGPCSFEIYSSLEKLEKEGFIEVVPSSFRWRYYKISKKERKYIEEIIGIIDKQILEKIKTVKQMVLSKSFIELLSYVYKKYPEYAKNSIINIEVLEK